MRPAPTAREIAGGRILVRPPALVEAAQGVLAGARCAQESADAFAASLTSAVAFGAARGSYTAVGRAWLEELRLVVHDAAALAARLEAAAGDYVRTDVLAGGGAPS